MVFTLPVQVSQPQKLRKTLGFQDYRDLADSVWFQEIVPVSVGT